MADNLTPPEQPPTEPTSAPEIALFISLLCIIGTVALGFMGQTVSTQFSNVANMGLLTPS